MDAKVGAGVRTVGTGFIVMILVGKVLVISDVFDFSAEGVEEEQDANKITRQISNMVLILWFILVVPIGEQSHLWKM